MWFSFSTLVLVTMAFLRWIGFLDYFRLVFFCSPAWLTLIIAPFHSDHQPCKMFSHSAIVFLASWFTVHAYPSQCRQAWGTAMVSDKLFWDNPDAIADAILAEKNSYFSIAPVSHSERKVFWPKLPTNATAEFKPTRKDSIEAALKIIKDDDNRTKDSALVKKWIESWSGGLSMNIMKLRAYCNVHQADESIPHVYPLRVLGVLNTQANFTMPCPYWSCLMTEARPKGKLTFLLILGTTAALNFIYVRFQCQSCSAMSWFFGAGKPRIWWWWLWASLLPLCLVMLIKTTYDEEFLVVVMHMVHSFTDPILGYALDGPDGEDHTKNRLQLGVFLILFGVLWSYRAKLRHELGIEGFTLMQLISDGGELHHESKLTFQVCVWRVDVTNATAVPAPSSPRADGGFAALMDAEESDPEAAGNSPSVSARGLLLCGRGQRKGGSRWGLSGLFRRQEDSTVLKTADGRVPSLSVRFFYGMDEVQSTRSVRPTPGQWHNHDPVYFQENFKISVEHRPNAKLRVELRDTGASFGSLSLGSVTFDDAALEHMFLTSRQAGSQVRRGAVPVTQVVQMSAPPPVSEGQEQQQMSQLMGVGFAQHRFNDGGAVWLAMYEIDEDHHAPSSLCC